MEGATPPRSWNSIGRSLGLKELIKGELDYMTLCPGCYFLYWSFCPRGDCNITRLCPRRHRVAWVWLFVNKKPIWWPAKIYELGNKRYQFKFFFSLGDSLNLT